MTLDTWTTFASMIVTATLLVAVPAKADLSCQDRIVAPGDASFEVRSLCGPPDAIETRIERRVVRRPVTIPCAAGRCVVYVEDLVEIAVDEWTYDFGPRRFMQFLTFEQGKLVAIHAGGYGHKLE